MFLVAIYFINQAEIYGCFFIHFVSNKIFIRLVKKNNIMVHWYLLPNGILNLL